jgi:hypothetical protein
LENHQPIKTNAYFNVTYVGKFHMGRGWFSRLNLADYYRGSVGPLKVSHWQTIGAL